MLINVCSNLFLCALVILSSPQKQKDPPKLTLDAELAALATALDGAPKDSVAELVATFAQKHAPTKEPVLLLTSTDKSVCVAIGASGTEKKPNGTDVELIPKGTRYSIALAGAGFDSTTGDGGNGGTVTFKGKSAGKVILIAGRGGKGADGKPKEAGKTGGAGGNVWFGKFLKDTDAAIPGAGGLAGAGGAGGSGGAGGRGGSAGPEAP